jgi:ATP-independent RNA helicase DbpA
MIENTDNSFESLDIKEEFKKNIKSLDFLHMTNIQKLCIKPILEKNDVIAQAKTGSGKTATFAIPIIENLDIENFATQSLILVPTRELANQVAQQIRKLARHIHNVKVLTLIGGVPYKVQVESLKFGAHIIVGTPGRVLQHLFETKITFPNINCLVLDEADKMLDMGFYDDILKIINELPSKRQTLLFSATYEENIKELSQKITYEALFLKDESVHTPQSINQKFYCINDKEKADSLPYFISSNNAESTLIFSNTKIECENIANNLYEKGLDVLVLHSDLDQKQRDEIMILFSNKSYPILIATDIASRGLDIDDIDLVINYDLARDLHTHKHRIGRTARAGKKGLAISFFNNEDIDNKKFLVDEFNLELEEISNINNSKIYEIDSAFRTIYLNSGKKNKLRAGDILGALTAAIGLDKNDIGKIDILTFCSYVAVKKEVLNKALDGLKNNKVKGRFLKAYEK